MNKTRFLLSIYNGLANRKLLSYLSTLDKDDKKTWQSIREYWISKLQYLLAYSRKNCKYYRRILKDIKTNGNILNSFQGVSLLEKNIIREDFVQFQAEPYKNSSNLIFDTTSGSTEEPLKFAYDKGYRDIRWALIYYNLMWCGYKLGDPHAYLYGSFNDWEKDITFRSRLQHFMMKSFVLNVYQNLTEENMLWFINKMKERDTKYLIGYASALYALAEFIEQKGIDISMYIKLRGIVSTAEYLYDEYRRLIEKNFRCPVFNRYGCREVGNIAHECQGHSGLHINWQNIIIELFDGQRCYLPYEGDHAEGEIIITCLNNFGMPLIRYRTGDIGEFLASKCQCGLNSPLLKIKAGRVSDQFYTKKGEIILGCNFSRLAFSFKGIKQAQFVQNSYVDFTINIVRSSEGIDQDLRLIESKFKEWFGSDIIIHYNFVEKIERELSGKYRYSKSFVNNTFKHNENTSC